MEPRKNPLIFTVVWSLLCLAVAGALVALGGWRAFWILSGPIDFSSLPAGQLEGRYVEMEVTVVLEEYAYSERTGGASGLVSREFAVATPDGMHYIGVLAPKAEFETLAQPLASMAYDDYPVAASVTVTGTVYPMDELTAGLFDKALDYHGVTPDMALHLYVEAGAVGRLSPTMTLLMFAAAVALVLAALIMLAMGLSRRRKNHE